MAYWLIKSEPNAWGWESQVKCDTKGTEWSGIRNHTAKQNLMKMQKGDQCFFYHSNIGKEIVGIVEVIKEHFPDETDETKKFVAVKVKAVKPLKKPVTLAQIKAEPKLEGIELVKYSRLSVAKISAKEWGIICKMGGLK